METLNPNPRSGRTSSETIYPSSSNRRMGSGLDTSSNRQRIFRLKHNPSVNGTGCAGGEGYQKLKNRLISRGVPESILDELFEQPTIVSYRRGSFIFFQGAPTDLLFWVSSGLVDILYPGPDGEEIYASVLGPGEVFGLIESSDHRGRPTQAFQARARSNVQVGLLIREQVYKVLRRQDPALLVHLMGELAATLSEVTIRYTQFLGKNYNGRLKMVLADLASRFGVKDSRGTLLIPEFGHSDFAEMIGCSRPMASRLIAEMISAGCLEQDGKHYIIADDSALKSENGRNS